MEVLIANIRLRHIITFAGRAELILVRRRLCCHLAAMTAMAAATVSATVAAG